MPWSNLRQLLNIRKGYLDKLAYSLMSHFEIFPLLKHCVKKCSIVNWHPWCLMLFFITVTIVSKYLDINYLIKFFSSVWYCFKTRPSFSCYYFLLLIISSVAIGIKTVKHAWLITSAFIWNNSNDKKRSCLKIKWNSTWLLEQSISVFVNY